jgi:hypothetical protein
MRAMFSIIAISFDEFKRHFSAVEGADAYPLQPKISLHDVTLGLDTASLLVWVDAQLQQVGASTMAAFFSQPQISFREALLVRAAF